MSATFRTLIAVAALASTLGPGSAAGAAVAQATASAIAAPADTALTPVGKPGLNYDSLCTERFDDLKARYGYWTARYLKARCREKYGIVL